MTENGIQLLKAKIDNGAIIIHFIDGEKVTAKILSVSESEQDVIFDVLSSNRQKSFDAQSARLAHFDEIDSVM